MKKKKELTDTQKQILLSKGKKGKGKKKGCLVAFGFTFIIIVAVVVIALVSEEEKKSTETGKTPVTEEAPKAEVLKAEIRFDGSQFIITNNDNFDWTDVKFQLNEGIIRAGYRLNTDRVEAGHIYTVGVLQFAKPDGTRFNPITMKPQSMFIFCDQGSWNGEWD